MIAALFALVQTLKKAWLVEAAGAGLLIAAAALAWGLAAALAVGGGCCVLKAFDMEGRRP